MTSARHLEVRSFDELLQLARVTGRSRVSALSLGELVGKPRHAIALLERLRTDDYPKGLPLGQLAGDRGTALILQGANRESRAELFGGLVQQVLALPSDGVDLLAHLGELGLEELRQRSVRSCVHLDRPGLARFRRTTAEELLTLEHPDTQETKLAQGVAQGRMIPAAPGITPGSGPGHLGLFGYDPLEFQVGRGVIEALGLGVELKPGDVCARANFATLDAKGIVTDRRAGRIPTEVCEKLCALLAAKIKKIGDTQVIIKAGKEQIGRAHV